ncbi:SH3 domain-containing protein [Azospirillum sp. ST 5-10]|uniref:SH3 domain-containing protein n=1 Tax=unclassified Azospirillum TaxID=2630922 RepID=UPI003F4A34A1
MARHPLTPARLLLAAALALFLPAAAAPAQSPVAVGAPLEGEVVLNRDVEVRAAPDQNARIVLTLQRGKALNALGTPRGTSWTQVAIGGRPIGYVPMDALDPVYAPRPQSGTGGAGTGGAGAGGPGAGAPAAAALVPHDAWSGAAPAAAAAGPRGPQGYVVATRNVGATELLDGKKRRHLTVRKGEVAGLVDVTNGRLTLALPGRAPVVAGVDGFLGIATSYPLPGVPPLGIGPVYVARLGEYVSYGEGVRAWTEFTAGPGAQWGDRPPMVWPVFRGGTAVYEMGVGPFDRGQIDGVCSVLARRGRDCALAELAVF